MNFNSGQELSDHSQVEIWETSTPHLGNIVLYGKVESIHNPGYQLIEQDMCFSCYLNQRWHI